jgi:hypothetical protein
MSQSGHVETDRAKYWRSVVGQWEWSGLSQVEFCRQRGINGGTFAWWKRRLRRASGDLPARRGRPRKVAERFVEVRVASASEVEPAGASSCPAYEVVLARGRSIRVPSQFDAQTLSRLISTVESC